MGKKSQKKYIKTKQKRHRKYFKPKPATLWEILDDKSKQALLDVKAKIIMRDN